MKCSLRTGGCSTCINRKRTEWQDLEGPALSLLDEKMCFNEYAPGEVIYHQGETAEGIFCIKSGLIGERHLNADGNSILIRLNYPGSTMGYQAFLTKSQFQNSAEVLQAAQVCFIDRTTVAQLLEYHPSVGHRFLQHSLNDTQKMEEAYVAYATKDVRKRLLHLLLVLYERYGERDESGTFILEIPIARKEIAELVGATPESISRTILKLNTGRLVQIDGPIARFRDLNAVYAEVRH